MEPMPVRPKAPALLLGALLLLAVGCGDASGPAAGDGAKGPAAAPSRPVPRPRPRVPAVEPLERARFHLARLLTGPTRTGTLRVPEVYRRTLEISRGELILLRDQTLELLADERLRARLIDTHLKNIDPWHNVLDVLKALEAVPPDLLRAWVAPALESPVVAVRRAAARALSTLREESLADLFRAFLEQDGADREIGRLAFLGLNELGPRAARDAMLTVLTAGGPRLWEALPDRLVAGLAPGARDPERATLLAWWAVLAEGSGPRLDTELPRIKDFPWAGLRLALDPALARRREPAPGGAGANEAPPLEWALGPLDVWQAYGTGWMTADTFTCYAQPVFATYLTGSEPAARARCLLALAGYPGYAAAVVADRGLAEVDELVYFTALHCMGVGEAPGGGVLAQVEAIAAALARGEAPAPERVTRLVQALPACDASPRARDVLRALLRTARPWDAWRETLEACYDALAPCAAERTAALGALLAASGPEDLGLALHLIRREPAEEHLDALAARLAQAPPGLVPTLRRVLLYLHARVHPLAPERRARFVAEVERWIAAAGEQEAAGLATALLDLGPEGEAAFLAALSDPRRRRAFLAALPDDGRIYPPALAEALIDGLDDQTPREELEHLLVRGYSAFPLQAASALAALKMRLPAEAAGWVDTVLEQVRHRSAR